MVLLGGVAYFLNDNKSQNESKTSVNLADREFAVEDIKEVYKISLQKGNQDGFLLEKDEKGIWWLNKKYEVNKGPMDYLLRTISNIEIQNIPSSKAIPNMLEEMDVVGIKVKIYNKSSKLIKSYIVGTKAFDGKGTTMLMDGYDQPYNMFIKGFEGDLRTRYFVSIDKWRNRRVFESKPDDIEYVEVRYNKKESESFKINNTEKEPSISRTSRFVNDNATTYSVIKIKDYLGGFRKLYAEDFGNDHPKRDSISNLIPFATVTLKTKDNDPKKVRFYSFFETMTSNATPQQIENAGKVDRYYAIMPNDDFLLVQGGVFREIFRPYSYFKKD